MNTQESAIEYKRAIWRKAGAKYRERHRDRVRTSDRKYKDANRELLNLRARQYRLANPEKQREAVRKCNAKKRHERRQYQKRYSATHREQINKKQRRWWKKNPDKARALAAKHKSLRKARKLAVIIEEAANRWCKEIKSKPNVNCYYCGRKLKPKERHIEHIIPLVKGGGHTMDNLCVACGQCNSRKKDFPLTKLNVQLQQPVLIL